MTCPAVWTQSETVGTLAVVAANGVAADAIAAACSSVVTFIDICESEEKKVKKKKRREEKKKSFIERIGEAFQ